MGIGLRSAGESLTQRATADEGSAYLHTEFVVRRPGCRIDQVLVVQVANVLDEFGKHSGDITSAGRSVGTLDAIPVLFGLADHIFSCEVEHECQNRAVEVAAVLPEVLCGNFCALAGCFDDGNALTVLLLMPDLEIATRVSVAFRPFDEGVTKLALDDNADGHHAVFDPHLELKGGKGRLWRSARVWCRLFRPRWQGCHLSASFVPTLTTIP